MCIFQCFSTAILLRTRERAIEYAMEWERDFIKGLPSTAKCNGETLQALDKVISIWPPLPFFWYNNVFSFISILCKSACWSQTPIKPKKKSVFLQMLCILSLCSRLIWFLNYQNITLCACLSRVRSKIFSYAFLAFFFIHVRIFV